MSNLVFTHAGRVWRVSLDGDEVTLRHGIDEITFTNVGDLKEQIKDELDNHTAITYSSHN